MSVVVPLYNEELVIEEMHKRLNAVLDKAGFEYEVLMINDGSKDRTVELAKRICKADRRTKLISFSRNFGHQIAITAGMDRSDGQVIVIIDADLQDPPEVILDMVEKWKQGYQVVFGTRAKRRGEGIFKLATANIFYRFLKKITNVEIPVDTGDFRLMDAKVVSQLKVMKEKNRFVRGMVSWVGFRQAKVEYIREERFAGETKYPLTKMVKFALDGIFSFSQIPLKIATSFGLICSVISFVYLLYVLGLKIFFQGKDIQSWHYILISMGFLVGIQLMTIGILGEYIGRIYEETKNRPIYVVDEEINF